MNVNENIIKNKSDRLAFKYFTTTVLNTTNTCHLKSSTQISPLDNPLDSKGLAYAKLYKGNILRIDSEITQEEWDELTTGYFDFDLEYEFDNISTNSQTISDNRSEININKFDPVKLSLFDPVKLSSLDPVNCPSNDFKGSPDTRDLTLSGNQFDNNMISEDGKTRKYITLLFNKGKSYDDPDYPSVIRDDGVVEYWLNRKLHRNDYESKKIISDYESKKNVSDYESKKNVSDYESKNYKGENNLPAIIYPDSSREYWKHGKRHRDNNQPTIICASDCKPKNWPYNYRIAYFVDDMLHCVKKPAAIYFDGKEEYYVWNKLVSCHNNLSKRAIIIPSNDVEDDVNGKSRIKKNKKNKRVKCCNTVKVISTIIIVSSITFLLIKV